MSNHERFDPSNPYKVTPRNSIESQINVWDKRPVGYHFPSVHMEFNTYEDETENLPSQQVKQYEPMIPRYLLEVPLEQQTTETTTGPLQNEPTKLVPELTPIQEMTPGEEYPIQKIA